LDKAFEVKNLKDLTYFFGLDSFWSKKFERSHLFLWSWSCQKH